MQLIEITYRFRSDDPGRPDQVVWVPDHDEAKTRSEIATHDAVVTGRRAVAWQEQLAQHESPEI